MKPGPQNPAAERRPNLGWTRARAVFKWFRISLLALVLFAMALLLWCNYAGVPGAIAGLLKAELRRKNLDVEFSRLKLQGVSRLVASDLRFNAADEEAPRAEAGEAEILLDFHRIGQGEIEIAGLRLTNGELLVPINTPQEPLRFLTVSNVSAVIDWQAGDTLRVSKVSAEALGARMEASGLLRNFSRWTQPSGELKAGGAWKRWKAQLRAMADVVEALEFAEPPVISLRILGDPSEPAGLRGNFRLAAGRAESRWGSIEQLDLSSGIYPARSGDAVTGLFSFHVNGLRSAWGSTDGARLEAETVWTRQMDQLVTNRIAFSATNLESRWGNAMEATALMESSRQTGTNLLVSRTSASVSELRSEDHALGAVTFEGSLWHALPFPSPAAWLHRVLHGGEVEPADFRFNGDWRLYSTGLRLARSSFDSIELSGQVKGNGGVSGDESLGAWRYLTPLEIPFRVAISNVLSEDLNVGSIAASGRWSHPSLEIEEFDARLYGGSLRSSAALDVEKRHASASVQGDFDYQKIARLLDRPVQRWLAQFTWDAPPYVQAEIGADLPAWTSDWSEAEGAILPTVATKGLIKGAANYREIPISNAEGRFYFSNYVWRLPEFLLVRPEGSTVLDYTGNVTNGDFSCRIEARLDPSSFRSLAPEENRRGFDLVRFPEALVLAGEASGNWDRKEEIVFRGRFAATNFFVRDRLIGDVSGDLRWSNLLAEAWNVTAHLGTGAVHAPYLRLDWPAGVMFVTNVTSTANPYDAMYIVGPESYHAIDPYRFAIPPRVTVNGLVPLRHPSAADLWFTVDGDEFTFWKFHLPHLTGDIHWRANELWITNVAAAFYRGRARWHGYFFIHDQPGDDNADFQFEGTAEDADLKWFVADLFGMTNQMEGIFSGKLTITSANSDDPKSWNGHGEATLHDGFLWSVPVFGVFTPAIDAILPGESMGRVTSGTGHFGITNSVVHTRDLTVRTKAFRLTYKGSVNLEGELDALVDAQMFRDAWLVGKAFSIALWPLAKAFEARVSGTVTEPKTQFRYIPKLLLVPFKALKILAEPEKKETISGPNEGR